MGQMGSMSEQPVKILFICMGNICRSPLAECLFRHKAEQRGVADRFFIDSAGTGGWHAGNRPDSRMRQCAKARNVNVDGRARQVRQQDFSHFDYLICMDEDNRENLLDMGAPPHKVHLLLEFNPDAPVREVPDPYYGGMEGFDTVYDLVDAACDALLDAFLDQVRLDS